MRKNAKISVKGVQARVTPLGFHMYAKEFLEAAVSLKPRVVPFSPVQNYLFCRALELGLKALLCAKGIPLKTLARRPYRHNLEELLNEAKRRDLLSLVSLEQKHFDEICRANKYYGEKVFEYPAIGEAIKGYPDKPNVAVLRSSAELLIKHTEQLCLNA